MRGFTLPLPPMRRAGIAGLAIIVLALAVPALAHPVPFSYLDVQLQKTSIDVSLVAHIFDVAHDLQVTPVERLLESSTIAEREVAIRTMLAPRLELSADGRVLAPEWDAIEI